MRAYLVHMNGCAWATLCPPQGTHCCMRCPLCNLFWHVNSGCSCLCTWACTHDRAHVWSLSYALVLFFFFCGGRAVILSPQGHVLWNMLAAFVVTLPVLLFWQFHTMVHLSAVMLLSLWKYYSLNSTSQETRAGQCKVHGRSRTVRSTTARTSLHTRTKVNDFVSAYLSAFSDFSVLLSLQLHVSTARIFNINIISVLFHLLSCLNNEQAVVGFAV